MRVLVLTNMYPTATEPWFGSFVADQVGALRELGVEVDVAAFDGRRKRRVYLAAFARVSRGARRRRYDLIHAHYGLTGAVAMLQRWTPVVTTFHGSDVWLSRQRFISWAVARATSPIFVSRELARRVGVDDACVLPAAVDTVRFAPEDPAKARRALGWPAEGEIVLFPSSRANRVKRVELFDATLELVRAALPSVRGVSLQGYTREDVVHVMNAVDATLLTSWWEGSPVSVKESLACGTPVVSVPVGDVAELVRYLPGCSVTEPRPESLARAVIEAVRQSPSPHLRERALRYSSLEVARALVARYDEILRRRTLPEGSRRGGGDCS
jgi:glycosyltransferase involved in cell wall biosynthesis